MNRNRCFFIRFVLSNNLPGSATRIAADTANVFTRFGIPATILYPAVDWWDYKRFTLSRMTGLGAWKQRLRMAGEVLVSVPFRRRWCGRRLHSLDPRVETRRFLFSPSAHLWDHEGVTVVHPPYLVPHLLMGLASAEVRIVSAIHVNLEKAMRSTSPEAAAWYTHWVAMERYLSVPRYATSEEARDAAERLGIPIRRVIPGGVDLHLFHPGPARPAGGPPVILLYCDPNPQKGRDVGVEALRQVKSEAPQVQLYSVGRVTREQASLFDRNYGYLHGEAYAKALRACDIFVYPSRYDGFPAPPLQAMASGVALVTTAVEGVTDYAEDGTNCLLCRPGDAEEMSRQVGRLIQDDTLRGRLRSRGPLTAERFRIEQSAAQLLDFLKEVAG